MLDVNIYGSIFNSEDNRHIAYKEWNFIPLVLYHGNSQNHSLSITVTI